MKTSKILLLLCLMLFLNYSCNDDEFLTPDFVDQQLDVRTAFPDIIDLPDGFQPEGIVVGTGHDAYAGSIYSGEIWKFDLRTGAGAVLVEASFLPIVGLSYDHRTKYLFAARGYAGVVSVFDSQTGAKLKDYIMTPPGPLPTTWVNDLIVTKKSVYVSDSFREYMYKIPLGPGGQLSDQSEVEEILLSGDFALNTTPGPTGFYFNGNGIEATRNGKHLFLAHSDFGYIYLVDPKTGETIQVDFGGETFPNADGILLNGKENGYTMYVVQNFFNQVVKLHINADLISGNVEEVITNIEFKVPTTLDEFGESLYILNARFDLASPFAPAPDVPFDIVRIDK